MALAKAGSAELKAAQLERRAREETWRARGGVTGRPSIWSAAIRSSAGSTILMRSMVAFRRHNVNVGFQARVPMFSAATGRRWRSRARELVEADAAIKHQEDRIALDVQRAAQAARQAAAASHVAGIAAGDRSGGRASDRRASGRRARPTVWIVGKALVEEGRAWDEFFQAEFERARAQLQLRRLTGELSRLFP